MRLPWTTARRPPSSKFVTEMPVAAPSTRLPEMTAPSKANSAKIATSPMRAMVFARIWTFEAELARTAEKAQSAMRFDVTRTLPARKTLMALPFSPVPPSRAAMRSMRFMATIVPSSPLARTPDEDAVVADDRRGGCAKSRGRLRRRG